MADAARMWAVAREEMGATYAEVAVMKALHESDYGDLIGLAFLPAVARIAVAAARGELAEEFAVAIEDASAGAKAYHYKAAVAKAARELLTATDDVRRDVAYSVRKSLGLSEWMAYLRAHRPIDTPVDMRATERPAGDPGSSPSGSSS